MVFSSIEFLWFFMPAVLLFYAAVPPWGRNALLAAVSLGLLRVGRPRDPVRLPREHLHQLHRGKAHRPVPGAGRDEAARRTMWVAVVANLAILFTWKYTLFAVEQLNAVLGLAGETKIPEPSITLPIGISFFTFHGIS